MYDRAMCNFFQKSESSKYREKRFGYPDSYPVPVRRQFLDIRIRLQTHLPDIQPANRIVIISVRDTPVLTQFKQNSRFVIQTAWIVQCNGCAPCLLHLWLSVRISPCRILICFFSFNFHFVFFLYLFSGLRFTFTGQCEVRDRIALGQLSLGLGLVLDKGQASLGLGQCQLSLGLGQGKCQCQVSLGLTQLSLGLGQRQVSIRLGLGLGWGYGQG